MATSRTDKEKARITVLLAWREQAHAAGHPVPTRADTREIAQAAEFWPPGIDLSAAEPWRETFAWLFQQFRYGALDPLAHLPDHLRAPRPAAHALDAEGPPASERPSSDSSSAGPAAPDPTDPDAVLARVLQWRDRAVANSVSGAGDLKPGHVRSLVSRGLRSAEEIAAGLPPTLGHLATDLAAVLGGGQETGSVPPRSDEVPAAEPAAPRHRPRPRPEAEPGADPAAEPDADAERGADRGPAVDAQLKGLTFARYRYQEVPPATEEVLVAENDVTGGVVLSWPDTVTDGAGGRPPVVIYRVVSDDHAEPYSPDDDDADVIAVTCSTTANDDRPFERAVRHFAVWCHAGATEAEAAAAQPVPHAVGYHVVPPRDVEIHYDRPRVVGGWHALDGTALIQVTRTLRRLGRGAPHEERWDGFEQFDEGFKDTRPVPGEDYLYWVSAGVQIGDATVMSQRVRCRVQIPPLHEPVRDLEIVQHVTVDEHGRRHQEFDLSWTQPPHGRVYIYRTHEPPADGLVGHKLGMSALPKAGLPLEARLHDRPRYSGRRATVENVPWPAETHRAYFTPVTELDGKAQVGETRSESRLGEIGQPRIVERVQEQIITFEWPAGATSVWLYRRAGGGAAPCSVSATPRSRSTSTSGSVGSACGSTSGASGCGSYPCYTRRVRAPSRASRCPSTTGAWCHCTTRWR